MKHLNDYLEQFVSQSASELRLEPNAKPYVITAGGNQDVAPAPLNGAQINTIIFSLIPSDVKKDLPNSDEVNFTHPHTLGSFDFSVKKSPTGFNVIVTKAANGAPAISTHEVAESPQPVATIEPNAAPKMPPVQNIEVEAIEIETTQPPAAAKPLQTQPVSNTSQPIIETFEPVQQSAPVVEVQSAPPVSAPAPSPVSNLGGSKDTSKMDALFKKMAEVGASDLHMSVSMPPMIRNDGRMAKLDESVPALQAEPMKQLLESIMPEKNIKEFAERNDTDFAYEIPGLARFRANIFMDRKGMGGVFRIIPSDILTAETLGLSKHILDLCDLSKGLVVVTGPTGSGKSTTLCAMVDHINKQREDHIITIEDPIEFTHENQKCLVNQREVHNHTDSFKDALRAALREDPDILLVGEMRDLETISIAIETAETGHLVFGTLHTTTAASTIDRIIDQFPADRQQQVRVMLSESLRGVIAQTLLPKIGGGRIAALEILIVTPAISNLIREGKTFQIPSAMQTGKNKGMVMLNDALMDLVNKGLVEPKDAYIKAVDKANFEVLLARNGKKI